MDGPYLMQNNLIQLKKTPGFKNQKGFIIFSQFKPKPAIVYAFRQMTSYFLLDELISEKINVRIRAK